jgi:uncharacterized protein (TIGR02246 family)
MDRRLFSAIAAAAAVVLAAACAGPTSTTEFGKADADEIRAMVRDFVAAYNAKDVEKIGGFFAANASLMPINRNTLRGVEAVKGYYDGRVHEEGGTDLAIDPVSVDGHGSLGYVAANFSMNFRPPDGSAGSHDRGKVVWILRKLGGHWKFEYQIMNSDLPAAVPAAR